MDEKEQGELRLPSISKPSFTLNATFVQDSSNILVAVRGRPLNLREQGTRQTLRFVGGKLVIVLNKTSNSSDYLRQGRATEKRFHFDHAFDHKVSSKEVYNKTARHLISKVVQGFNGTVFAYGATGAGKTYTMLGTQREPGIMALTLTDLFRKIKEGQEDLEDE